MKNSSVPAIQENQTIPISNRDSLPVAKELSEFEFSAQIIPEKFERFRADPNAPAAEIFIEALKALNEGQLEFDPKDYHILIASPLMEKQRPASDKPKMAGVEENAILKNMLNNGSYVFFVKSVGGPAKLEIWISDQKILVIDTRQLLIGRGDDLNGIHPDLDLTPYLAENVLKVSRKQAWLMEKDGHWSIQLHENASSPVFLNDGEQLEQGRVYEILDNTRLGFGGVLNRSYLYMTLKIIRH